MQTQTRDQLREHIQRDIRQSIRDAVGDARAGDVAGRAAIGGAGPQGPGGGGLLGPLPPRDAALQLLQAELAGARAQVQALTESLSPGQSEARENAIEEQLERATSRVESLEDQYSAVLTGRAVSGTRQEPANRDNGMPAEVKEMSIWFFCTAAVTIVALGIIRPWARWLDRRAHAAPAGPDMSPRLDQIEQAIEAVAIEVERISEGQRYTNKIMTDARALPAPGLPERWPAVAEREPVPARRQGED